MSELKLRPPKAGKPTDGHIESRHGGCRMRTCCDRVSATVNAPLDLFVQFSNVKEHRALVKRAGDFQQRVIAITRKFHTP